MHERIPIEIYLGEIKSADKEVISRTVRIYVLSVFQKRQIPAPFTITMNQIPAALDKCIQLIKLRQRQRNLNISDPVMIADISHLIIPGFSAPSVNAFSVATKGSSFLLMPCDRNRNKLR